MADRQVVEDCSVPRKDESRLKTDREYDKKELLTIIPIDKDWVIPTGGRHFYAVDSSTRDCATHRPPPYAHVRKNDKRFQIIFIKEVALWQHLEQ